MVTLWRIHAACSEICLLGAITRVTPAARIRNKSMVDFDTRKGGLLKIHIMVLI